ncbi:trichohyalin-like protein 1 [Dromiciops gliroides]|uniref:trichohyalin-like protein 1 n=1 Tax=Dromiciops gliroides TaxID=33562 RepID=UPI001CC66F18|nr:trichohyalin-like protein 1 [Dromiciops gliroides]
MPQLLQSVICVIETFQKYARKEGDCWTLSPGQLKQLLLGEIGDFLKPFNILTAGTNLNLLDKVGNETISFDEFILLVFELLNICYQDMQSFLNTESKPASNAEEELSEGMETWETSGDYQEEAGLGQYEQRLTGTESTSLVSPIEKVPDTLTKEEHQDDLETPRLLGREVEHNHPKSPSQGEEDGHSQERTQQIQTTGSDGVPPEEIKPPKEFVKRACSQKGEKIVNEGHEVPRELGGTDTRDHPSDQEREQNMEIQSVHTEERAQRTSESQGGTIIKESGEHIETQGPSSQENCENESETDDLPTERTEEKLPETERLLEYRDEDGTADIQEPLVQGRENETQDMLAKGDDCRVQEIEVLIDERKVKRKFEKSDTVGQKENEKNNQKETFTEQEPDGKEKQLEGLAEEGDIRKDPGTPDLKSGDDQNHPEDKGPAASKEEVTVSEKSEPEFPGDDRSASVAERTPETKGRVQGSVPQDDQSEGKDETRTLDQPIEQYSGHQLKNQNDGTLSETSNNPEDDDSVSEPRDLPAQRNSQSQMDAQEQPEQGDGRNTQESPVLGDKSRTPETEVPIDREDNENITEEQEQLAREKKKSSGVKTPATTEEPDSQPGSQGSMKQKVTATSPKTEVIDPTDDDDDGQQAEKDHRKGLEAHGPDSKEEEEESESQEALLEGQDPETQGLTLDASSDALNPVTKGDKSSQKSVGEGNEQHVANKEDDSSSGLSELVERKTSSSSGDEVHSNPIYEDLQKTPAQSDLPAPEEHLDQSDSSQASGPKLRVKKEPQKSETSDCPALLNPLCDYRPKPRHQVGDPEPDEEYGNQQETLASHSQEDGQSQQKDQRQQRDGHPQKC